VEQIQYFPAAQAPENPYFSILIPSWNNLPFLQLCIRSIREHSIVQFELIVHLNEGKDGSLEWVRDQQDIAFTHSETNVGVCHAMNAMRELLRFELPEMGSSARYICANYFITSREVFITYMDDATKLLDLFLAKYPLYSKCPFEIPAHEYNGRLRCAGYFMERYINIWAVHNNISLVYAVDEPSWRLK